MHSNCTHSRTGGIDNFICLMATKTNAHAQNYWHLAFVLVFRVLDDTFANGPWQIMHAHTTIPFE